MVDPSFFVAVLIKIIVVCCFVCLAWIRQEELANMNANTNQNSYQSTTGTYPTQAYPAQVYPAQAPNNQNQMAYPSQNSGFGGQNFGNVPPPPPPPPPGSVF